MVVGGASIDMVYGVPRGNSTTGSHPYSMRDIDTFMMTESVLKLQIIRLAMGICIAKADRRSIHKRFSSIGIDAHSAGLCSGAIERDTCFRAGADIGNANIVK